MKKLVAIVAIVALAALLAAAPVRQAEAGVAEAALALGAFAVFNQLVFGPLWARPWYEPVYVTSSPVVYSAPAYAPSYAPPPAPLVQREVVYRDGRYLLFGNGVTTAYQWVWVPNPPPADSAPSR